MKPKSPIGLVRGAIAFVYSRIHRGGTRLVEMLAALVLMLLVSAIANVPPVLLGQIVTKAATKPEKLKGYDIFPKIYHIGRFDDVIPYLLLLGGLILAREVLTLVRKYLVEKVATSIEAEEYFLVSKHILSLDLGEMVSQRVGAVNVRIHRSIEGLVDFLKLSFIEFLPKILIALSALIYAFFQSSNVAVMMIAVASIGLLVTIIQINSQQGVRRYLFEAKAELSANISEVLLGIDYVRATGMITSEAQRTKTIAENFRQKEFQHHKWMMSFDSAKQLVEGLGYVTVIGFSAWLASRQEIDFGQVLTFAMLYLSFTTPLDDLHRILDEGWEACLKIRELVETYGKRSDPGLEGSARPVAASNIVICRDVTVSYENSEVKALDGINFELGEGEIVGIAGPSGSGKSSLIRLILGLNSTYSGRAELFGVEVRDIDKNELATLIAYVPQTPFLVKGSIRQNVTYTATMSSTVAEIDLALRSACFAEKTKEMGGLDSDISEQGRNLSGGERQRLALTRLFLSKAKLILLDEPTAALDAANQEAVQDAIFDFLRGRSALIVAHRLNTLKKADRIIVLDKGRIVESGSYAELASRAGGLFRSLVEKESLEERERLHEKPVEPEIPAVI